MSEKHPRQSAETRKKYVLEQITKISRQTIADNMGVHLRTIDRDIADMKAAGVYQEWVERSLFNLFRTGDVSDESKFRELAKLYGKTIIQKSEVKTDGEVTFILEAWRPNLDGDEDDEN